MTIQDAARIARVLTCYETQPADGEPTPLAQLLEEAFPKFEWRWDTAEGRYEVFMDAGDGEAVKGVLEPKEEKQPPSAKNGSSLLSGKQMPFDFQQI